MDFEKTRLEIRTVIFGIAGFLILLIFIGVLFEIAGDSNIFTSIANLLMSPFQGVFAIDGNPVFSSFHIDAVFIIGIYLFAAYVISEFITAFFFETGSEIVANVVDAFLKIIELFLFLRIVLDLFNALSNESVPAFVQFVYSITNWASGFIVNIFFGAVLVNVSAIIILVIVLILDVFCERFLESFFKSLGSASSSVSKKDLPEWRIKEKFMSIFKRDSED